MIEYELNGGANAAGNPTEYTIESGTITLAAPTKTGYVFGGWYTTEDFSGEAITQIESGSTGKVTLYAKWTAETEGGSPGTDDSGGDGQDDHLWIIPVVIAGAAVIAVAAVLIVKKMKTKNK